MRRNLKSTPFFPNSKSIGTANEIDSHSGVSTQRTGVSTQSTGVSTKNSEITNPKHMSTHNSGTSDTLWQGVSNLDAAVRTMNSYLGLGAEDMNNSLWSPQSSTESTSPEIQANGSSNGRANVSDNLNRTDESPKVSLSNLKRTANTRPKDGKRRMKRASDETNANEAERTGVTNKICAADPITKKRVAWSDVTNNNQSNDNDTLKLNPAKENETKTQQQIEDEIIKKKKREEEEILKSQRLEQMRVREKRAEYR